MGEDQAQIRKDDNTTSRPSWLAQLVAEDAKDNSGEIKAVGITKITICGRSRIEKGGPSSCGVVALGARSSISGVGGKNRRMIP